MVNNYAKYKAEGAEILAISVDPIEKNRELAEKLKIPFPILSDADRNTITTYDILDPGGKISKAVVLILDTKGIVRWAYVSSDYKVRPLDDDILAQLKKIT